MVPITLGLLHYIKFTPSTLLDATSMSCHIIIIGINQKFIRFSNRMHNFGVDGAS